MNTAIEPLKAQLEDLDLKIKEARSLAADPELGQLAQEDIKTLEVQKQALESSLRALTTVPTGRPTTDPDTLFDSNNAIIEIRGGTGGEEAKLFAEDLMRMYIRFSELKKLKAMNLDEGVVKITGRGAYGLFKSEAGVHRVQRVPATEASGRIHTSTATVTVLPEVSPTQITIRDEDLDWKFTRAGGHGGQNVNKVNTAVTLTHNPSGLVIHCRQERFQQQNKVIALELLRGRLWDLEEEKRLSKLTDARRHAVGRALRSEKIRTYNYPENRVTDHRIHQTWHHLTTIMDGNLDEVISAVKSPAIGTEPGLPE